MAEYLDVYSEVLKWMGSEERDRVHKNGKWHYVFHCWVYDQNKHQIILQRRAEDKVLFPRRYDVSCAGHYSSDEEQDSTRELVEELGLKVSYDALIYLMDFQDVFSFGEILDREIARVHLLITDTFEPSPLTPEEIECIVACDFDDFKALIENQKDEVKTVLLYGYNEDLRLTKEELVPRLAPYYQKVFELIQSQITKL